MKGDPLRAQKVRFELVEGTDSVGMARFCSPTFRVRHGSSLSIIMTRFT